MGIRAYIFGIIAVCTIGGLTLSAVLHTWFQKLEQRHSAVGESALTLKEVSYASESLASLRIIAPLVIEKGETRLAESAITQCKGTLANLDNLRSRPLLSTSASDLDFAHFQLSKLKQHLNDIAGASDHAAIDTKSILADFNSSSNHLVGVIERLKTSVRQITALSEEKLQHERQFFYTVSIWTVGLYVLSSFVLGSWAWSRMAQPLQALTVAAHRSMQDGCMFDHGDGGPREVRALSKTIGQFVGQLEDTVDDRTDQLREKTKHLESEIEVRIAIEDKLEAARIAAENANEAKSEFLANMSHEIRTPLNAILGFTDFLNDTQLDEEQANYARIVRSSGDSLLTLVNDILDFSKIEAGKLEIEQRPFYLRDCIESTIDAVAPRAMEGALNLGYHMPANTPCSIIGDEARFRQILLNLLGNAVKFTEAGAVEARVTIVHHEDTGRSELRCLVTDTGIGIASEKLGKLFQSFEQLESSTNRRFGGTGLGLAISKRLVELMGGSVSVESELGEGSTFAISLPVEIGNLEPRKFEKHLPQSLDDKHLLLLNPGKSSRETIIDHAEFWGCRIEVANTADEAIQRIKQGGRFDLIVTQADNDIASPEQQRELAASHLPTPPELIALRSHDIILPEGSPFRASVTTPLKPATLFKRIFDFSTPSTPGSETINLSKTARRNIAPATELQPLNLLVAEDVEVNRKLICLMLGKLGYQADYAKNGREAVEMACEMAYDIILMDMQMAELDGLQATVKIREQIPGDGPVILAVTANSMDRDRLRCLEAGMDDHLSKPLALPDLKSALSKWAPGSGGQKSRRAAEGLLA